MKNIKELFDWYETLTPASLKDIDNFYATQAFFKDPFNELIGIEGLTKIYQDMFEKLEKPHFKFIDRICDDDQIFLTWDFTFAIKGKEYLIHGSSHLKLNDKLLIIYHRDYWDVGEELLLKIPVIKNLYGPLRKKLSST